MEKKHKLVRLIYLRFINQSIQNPKGSPWRWPPRSCWASPRPRPSIDRDIMGYPTHSCIQNYIFTYHIYIYITYVCIYVFVFIYLTNLIQLDIRVYTYVYIYTYIHVYIYLCHRVVIWYSTSNKNGGILQDINNHFEGIWWDDHQQWGCVLGKWWIIVYNVIYFINLYQLDVSSAFVWKWGIPRYTGIAKRMVISWKHIH
jgi:hypothetical protein